MYDPHCVPVYVKLAQHTRHICQILQMSYERLNVQGLKNENVKAENCQFAISIVQQRGKWFHMHWEKVITISELNFWVISTFSNQDGAFCIFWLASVGYGFHNYPVGLQGKK